MGVKNTNPDKNPRKSFFYYYGIVLLVVFLLNTFLVPSMMGRSVKEVSYDQFLHFVEANQVDMVYQDEEGLMFTVKEGVEKEWGVTAYKTGLWPDASLTDRLLAAGVTFSQEIVTQPSLLSTIFVQWIIPIVLFIAIGQILGRTLQKKMGSMGNPAMTFGKSNAKIYAETETGKTFGDVAGQEEAKEALQEIVDFLHNPQKYAEIGATLPKGALLVGPPGTGKTLLAKAVAGEAHVPFFSISGSEFVEMFVGMGAAKVRDLFKQANEKAPCIVFIDEIDTIGKKRDGGGIGGNDEREQTLNQLLTEMDGFDGKKGVVILAATNRPESLDQALLRPGRFDRRIPVELPDLKGREAILKVHGKEVKLEDSVDFNSVARATSGASGAELANIVNDAAPYAQRAGQLH